MEQTIFCRSGEEIPEISSEKADARHLISRSLLEKMHLMANSDPVAYTLDELGNKEFYFDPQTVTEAPADVWYQKKKETLVQPISLENGSQIGRLRIKNAAKLGYFTAARLLQMHYEAVEPPVAYTLLGGEVVYLYDKMSATRLPLPCIKCGNDVRYKKKLCKACFEAEMSEKRAEGDLHRAAFYHMKRKEVLFFDLELTGVYDHDEILSISIVDGNGKVIMDTLIKPVKNKKWKRTEAIHGITPEMVVNAPTLASLTPEIKKIFAGAKNLIAYGISTDFSHIKKIYETEKEREALKEKTRCAANEYVRYIQEHAPEEKHASLTDAMAYFNITWDGIAHTSIADTIGCAKVWEKLFPHYYKD